MRAILLAVGQANRRAIDAAQRITGGVLGATVGMIIQRHATARTRGLRSGIARGAGDQHGPVARGNVGIDTPPFRRGRERAERLDLPGQPVRYNAGSARAVRDRDPVR